MLPREARDTQQVLAQLDEDSIVRIFVPIALVSIPFTLITGWLVDTIGPMAVAALASAAQVVMVLLLLEMGLGIEILRDLLWMKRTDWLLMRDFLQ